MSAQFTTDIAFVNANVRTMDLNRPRAQAVLVIDGRIAQVGSLADIRTAANGAPEFDCAGGTLLPGFVDGHCHFEMTCNTMDRWIHVHTPPHRSLADIAATIDREIRDGSFEDWILCRSSFSMQEKVTERRLFSRHDLDKICDDRPLAVFSAIHVASLNTVALHRLNLFKPTATHPHHGVVHRDEAGAPTGVVTEVFLMVPPAGSDTEFAESAVTHAKDMFNAAGTTTVHTIPESLEQVRVQRELHRSGALSLRQRYFLITPGVATLQEAVKLAAVDRDDDMFTFGGIKLFVNGCAHDGFGHELDDVKWTQEALNDFVLEAHCNKIQVWMHSLNSHGVRMAAEAIGNAMSSVPTPLRHRIEHGADYIDLADLALVKRSGARLVTTPQFLHSMAGTLAKTHAPLRSLIEAGMKPIGATDSTGTVPESVSVLGNVASAVTRQNALGLPVAEDEAIDVETAVRMFTTWSSEGAFEEDRKGQIREGYFADLTLLAEDPMSVAPESIRGIRVQATFLGGTQVY